MSSVKNRPANVRRNGFMLIEFLIALAFIALVTGLTLKMHRGQVERDRNLTQRLTDQLAVENIGQRLAMKPYEDLNDSAKELSDLSDVKIDVRPFESEAWNGLHIVITLDSDDGPTRHHLWRLEPES